MDEAVRVRAEAAVKKIEDTEVECEGCDYGVEYDLEGRPCLYVAEDEADARDVAVLLSGKVVARDVWVSAWAEVEG